MEMYFTVRLISFIVLNIYPSMSFFLDAAINMHLFIYLFYSTRYDDDDEGSLTFAAPLEPVGTRWNPL